MLFLSCGILWGRLDPEAKANAQPSGLWVQCVLETVREEETNKGGVLETFASFHPADVLHFLSGKAGLRSAMQIFLHRELMPTPAALGESLQQHRMSIWFLYCSRRGSK